MTRVMFPANDGDWILYKTDDVVLDPIPDGEEVIDFGLSATYGELTVHRNHAARALIVLAQFGVAAQYEAYLDAHPSWIKLRLVFTNGDPGYSDLGNALRQAGFRESYEG